MRRRDKAGRKALKTQRHKTLTRRNAPKGARRRNSSVASQEAEVARITHELEEAREQQAATSEVLRIISSFPGELEPVFSAILANAIRICESNFGVMLEFDDGVYSALSSMGDLPPFLLEQPHVLRQHPHNPLTHLAATKQPVHVPDLTTHRSYIERNPRIVALVKSAGGRSLSLCRCSRKAS